MPITEVMIYLLPLVQIELLLTLAQVILSLRMKLHNMAIDAEIKAAILTSQWTW